MFMRRCCCAPERDYTTDSWRFVCAKMVDDDLGFTHEPTSNLDVRAAHWISQEQAKNSLLKNRPDLQISHDSGDSGFLVLIAKRTGSCG